MTLTQAIIIAFIAGFLYLLVTGEMENRKYREYLRLHYTRLYESGEIYKDKSTLKKAIVMMEVSLLDDLAEKVWKDTPPDMADEIRRDWMLARLEARSTREPWETSAYPSDSGDE